jgi:AP-2 complex subunit mu-1
VSEGIQVPFKVMPAIKELGRTRLEANVSIRSTYGSKLFAINCVILVPVPEYTAKANISVSAGKAKYDPIRKALVRWGKRTGGSVWVVGGRVGWVTRGLVGIEERVDR